MKTTTKQLSDTQVELTVTLDGSDLQPARDAALRRLAQTVKLPGFRQGKAPLALAERAISPNDLSSETLDQAVRRTLMRALDQSKLLPLTSPRISVTKFVPEQTLEYVASVEILPEIKLGDIHKLKTKPPKITVSDAEVQEVLDRIAGAYSEKSVAQRPAAAKDEVIIDFTGKKDGTAFPGGSAKDYHLTLGSGQFIPGFEDGIIGHAAGDSFTLDLTFPKDYPESSLAGAKTTFDVLLKQVNAVKTPALDDALAQKCGDFKTLDDLKADIRKNLEAQNRHRAMEQYRDDLVMELVGASKVSAPEILIKDQFRFIKDDVTRNAASRGLTLEKYLERMGQTEEDWQKQARHIAEDRVKASLVLQVLAREQGITADDAEVDAKLAELRDVYQKSAEALKNLKKPEVRQDIKNRLILDKTLDFLVAANSDSAKPAKSAKAAKTTKPTKSSKAKPAKSKSTKSA